MQILVMAINTLLEDMYLFLDPSLPHIQQLLLTVLPTILLHLYLHNTLVATFQGQCSQVYNLVHLKPTAGKLTLSSLFLLRPLHLLVRPVALETLNPLVPAVGLYQALQPTREVNCLMWRRPTSMATLTLKLKIKAVPVFQVAQYLSLYQALSLCQMALPLQCQACTFHLVAQALVFLGILIMTTSS